MVQFIAGGKGEGKTKRLIDLANNCVKTTDGNLVFVDDDNRHIYDLNHAIRFVGTAGYPINSHGDFIGFICGIMSMDSDIKCIYVDGLTNIIKKIDDEGLVKLISRLNALSDREEVDFVLSMNCKADELPEEVKKLLVA